MYAKTFIILISTIICLCEAAFSQNIKQSVQTALENNENLKSQKALLDNSYQNFLIQKGRMVSKPIIKWYRDPIIKL